MKVNEIVREEKLDEALPLIAGLGAIPIIFSMVAAGLKAWSIYELYDVLSKNGYDIDNMSNDDKLTLFFTLITLFVPGGGKFTNAVLMKIMPDWVKRRGIKMVGEHLASKAQELRKMKNANRAKYANQPSTTPAQAAKNQKALVKDNTRLTAQYQAVGKQLAAEKLKDQAFTLVGGLALLPLTYTYYGKLDELDKQYAAHKSGDTATALFKDLDASAAWTEYSKLRNKYIGELTVGVTAALSRTPVVKLLDGFNKIIGKGAGAVGGKLVGGLVKLPIGILTKLAKVGGPALAVMMQTDEGQKFLGNSIVEIITKGVGAVTSTTINLLSIAIDSALGLAGVDSNLAQKTKGQEPPAEVEKAGQGRSKADIAGLSIKLDPKDPNIKIIGGAAVTGPDGFLLNNIENTVDNITNKAKGLSMPNPLDQIPRNPNLRYSY